MTRNNWGILTRAVIEMRHHHHYNTGNQRPAVLYEHVMVLDTSVELPSVELSFPRIRRFITINSISSRIL